MGPPGLGRHPRSESAIACLYVISYDLRKPGRNYQTLWDALRQMQARRVLESVWVATLAATGQGQAIFNTLNPHTDVNDGLIVFEKLDKQDCSKNLKP